MENTSAAFSGEADKKKPPEKPWRHGGCLMYAEGDRVGGAGMIELIA